MRLKMEAIKLTEAALLQACRDAALEVLEMMFFTLPESEPESGGPPCALEQCCEAIFEGSMEGRMRLSITEGCANILAAAFLGKDEGEISQAERESMLAELTNMICGATMSRLEPSGRLRIRPPAIVRECHSCPSPWLRIPLEGGSLALALEVGEV
jgi:CheY-specific phosphatase CheX